jgi:hypothetical protein
MLQPAAGCAHVCTARRSYADMSRETACWYRLDRRLFSSTRNFTCAARSATCSSDACRPSSTCVVTVVYWCWLTRCVLINVLLARAIPASVRPGPASSSVSRLLAAAVCKPTARSAAAYPAALSRGTPASCPVPTMYQRPLVKARM